MVEIAYKSYLILPKLIFLWLITILAYMASAGEESPNITKQYLFKNNFYSISDMSDKGLVLTQKDLLTDQENQLKLPCESMVKFRGETIKLKQFIPWSWSIGKTFYILFPNTWIDASGRLSFFLLADNKITDKKITAVTREKIHLHYLSSSLFVLTASWQGKTISDIKDYMWCNLLFLSEKAYIISRVRLGKNIDTGASKFDYEWEIRKNQGLKFAPVATVNISDDFLPFEVMWFPDNFKVLTDTDAPFDISPNIAFYIWGQSKSTGKVQLAEFELSKDDKVYNGKIKFIKAMPNSIFYNNDSKYVMLLYNKYKRNTLIKYLEDRNLLEKHEKPTTETPKTLQPPKQEEVSPSNKRGVLEAPPPEEFAQLLAQRPKPPKRLAFSPAEFTELFRKPDYATISDLYARARAYDWHGKFKEAFSTLKKASDSSIEAKFTLGNYYKQGRPGLKKDIKEAENVLSSIISDVSKTPSEMTGEDYCILGRAYMAQCNGDYGHDVSLKRNADKAFKLAKEKGYLLAWYYPEYYRRNSGRFNLQNLLKALPSHDPQVEAFVAGYAQSSDKKELEAYRNNAKNLAAIKAGIKSDDTTSQFLLGLLYAQKGIKSKDGYPLQKNLEKARFWLERAAVRGSQEAAQILKQDNLKAQPLRESEDEKYFRAGNKGFKLSAVMINENTKYKKFNCKRLTLTSKNIPSPVWQRDYFDPQHPDVQIEKLLFYAIFEDKKKQLAYIITLCNDPITNTSKFSIFEIDNDEYDEIKEISFSQENLLSDAFLYTANTDEKLYLALVSTDFDGKVKYYSFDKKTKQLTMMPTKASGVKYKMFR